MTASAATARATTASAAAARLMQRRRPPRRRRLAEHGHAWRARRRCPPGRVGGPRVAPALVRSSLCAAAPAETSFSTGQEPAAGCALARRFHRVTVEPGGFLFQASLEQRRRSRHTHSGRRRRSCRSRRASRPPPRARPSLTRIRAAGLAEAKGKAKGRWRPRRVARPAPHMTEKEARVKRTQRAGPGLCHMHVQEREGGCAPSAWRAVE